MVTAFTYLIVDFFKFARLCDRGVRTFGGLRAETRVKPKGGEFKRFGVKSHAKLSPHVHQPLRNVRCDGMIRGVVGKSTKNNGVTLPTLNDIKQLYKYFINNKYHP